MALACGRVDLDLVARLYLCVFRRRRIRLEDRRVAVNVVVGPGHLAILRSQCLNLLDVFRIEAILFEVFHQRVHAGLGECVLERRIAGNRLSKKRDRDR